MEENIFNPEETPVESKKTFFATVKEFFASPLMLVIAVLLTVTQAFSFIPVGEEGSVQFNILGILFTIGVWIIYANSKKDKSPLSGFSLVNGVVKAETIFSWIGAVGCFLAGVLILSLQNALIADLQDLIANLSLYLEGDDLLTVQQLIDEIETAFASELMFGTDEMIGILLTVFGASLVFGGIVFAVLAVFFGKTHLFTRSLYNSVKNGEDVLVNLNLAKGFVLFLAIMNTLTVFSSLFTAAVLLLPLSQAANTAALYCIYALLKKISNR